MQDDNNDARAIGTYRSWGVAVAVFFLAFGSVVVWESRRLGSEWGSDGPQAGYFPFYIGLFIIISSVANLLEALGAKESLRKTFVEWGQLKMILTVMVPSIVYVGLIANPWFALGIYVASAIFIGFFMRYLGHYSWPKIVAVSVGTVVVFFLMFEVWFKVPLPKGPLEAAFGFS